MKNVSMLLLNGAASRIILLALALFFCRPAPGAAALSASDLLVVYNRALPASEQVARYYAAQRNVPADNLIGLDLPHSEQISPDRYQAALYTPLRDRVSLLRRQGADPALLLVYGVPLKIGGMDSGVSGRLKKLGSEKGGAIGARVLDLTGQLSLLAAGEGGLSSGPVPPDTADPQEIVSHATETLDRLIAAQRREGAPVFDTETGKKIFSLMLGLAGITPLASGMEKTSLDTPNLREWTGEQKAVIRRSNQLERELAAVFFRGVTPDTAQGIAAMIRESRGLIGELRFWHELQQTDLKDRSSASVDSELSLLPAEPYSRANWLPNPRLSEYDRFPGIDAIRQQTIMVARLDGPTPEIAKRLVDDALFGEKEGLEGVFYIDARGLDPEKKDSAYARYDEYLRQLYRIVKEKSTLRVVLDNTRELFAESSAPEAALYCGWYSLGKYVDAFSWQRGAVGFHIASAEAVSLRAGDRALWCKTMLEKGAAATLGPVSEPYLHSFPRPDIFFPLLMQGRLPLLEVYYRSIPHLSWRQVLIGDPLYTPFRNRPALSE